MTKERNDWRLLRLLIAALVALTAGCSSELVASGDANPEQAFEEVSSEALRRPTARVYLLAGQSNMVGLGQLSSSYPIRHPYDIFAWADGSTGGFWHHLTTGLGATDIGRQDLTFGPELYFGERMANHHSDMVLLVKVAEGATDLHNDWAPLATPPRSGNKGYLYRRLLARLRGMSSGIAAYHNYNLQVEGVVFMQGESDAAGSEAHAQAYGANLRYFITRLRRDLRNMSQSTGHFSVDSNVPVVLGQIAAYGLERGNPVWRHAAEVRAGQQRATEMTNVYLVNTDALSLRHRYGDPYHYDTNGQRNLGRMFANALLSRSGSGAEPAPAPPPAATCTTPPWTVRSRLFNVNGTAYFSNISSHPTHAPAYCQCPNSRSINFSSGTPRYCSTPRGMQNGGVCGGNC